MHYRIRYCTIVQYIYCVYCVQQCFSHLRCDKNYILVYTIFRVCRKINFFNWIFVAKTIKIFKLFKYMILNIKISHYILYLIYFNLDFRKAFLDASKFKRFKSVSRCCKMHTYEYIVVQIVFKYSRQPYTFSLILICRKIIITVTIIYEYMRF